MSRPRAAMASVTEHRLRSKEYRASGVKGDGDLTTPFETTHNNESVYHSYSDNAFLSETVSAALDLISDNNSVSGVVYKKKQTEATQGTESATSDHSVAFHERFSDNAQFESIANSYGMTPAELLGKFIKEGGLGEYVVPAQRIENRYLLACWHLWQHHGLDDFAPTSRTPGRPDNSFNYNGNGLNSLLSGLRKLFLQGVLWNSNGVRPEDPAEQLEPQVIASFFAGAVNIATQLPDPITTFSILAARLTAAQLASRQHLIGRSSSQLLQMGYGEETAERFGYHGIDVVRAEIAMESGFVSSELSRSQVIESELPRLLESEEFLQCLMQSERYRQVLRESYESRTSVEMAGLSMGAGGTFPDVLEAIECDYRSWMAYSEDREMIAVWASEVNDSLFDLSTEQSRHESDAMRILETRITEELLPSRWARRNIRDMVSARSRHAGFAEAEEMMNYLIAVQQYSDTNVVNVEDWLRVVALRTINTEIVRRPSAVPRFVDDFMLPSAEELRAVRGGVFYNRVLTNTARYTREAQQILSGQGAVE